MNEIRNELLTILNLRKNGKDDEDFYTKLLLERFEYHIKDQLKDLEYKKQELENNLKTLNFVRKELGIEEK